MFLVCMCIQNITFAMNYQASRCLEYVSSPAQFACDLICLILLRFVGLSVVCRLVSFSFNAAVCDCNHIFTPQWPPPQGRPFVASFFEYKPLLIAVAASFILTFAILFELTPSLNSFLEFSPFPSTDFRTQLGKIIMVDLVATIGVETAAHFLLYKVSVLFIVFWDDCVVDYLFVTIAKARLCFRKRQVVGARCGRCCPLRYTSPGIRFRRRPLMVPLNQSTVLLLQSQRVT